MWRWFYFWYYWPWCSVFLFATHNLHTLGWKLAKPLWLRLKLQFLERKYKKIKLKTARLMQFQCLCGRIFFLFLCQVTWTCTSSHSFLLLDLQGIVGNLSSGKSALVHRYLTGTYVQEESPEGKSLLKKAWVRRWITNMMPSTKIRALQIKCSMFTVALLTSAPQLPQPVICITLLTMCEKLVLSAFC